MTTDDFKTAAVRARQVFAEFSKGEPIQDIRVEGIELSPDEQTWEVIVSYARPVPPYSPQAVLARMHPAMASPMERDSKLVRLRASDGELLGIRVMDDEDLAQGLRERARDLIQFDHLRGLS